MQLTDAEYTEASTILTKSGLIGTDQFTSFGHAIECAGDVSYRGWVQALAATPGTHEQQHRAWQEQYGNDAIRAVAILAHQYRA